MPRQARINAQGVLHHVMVRGIERRKIFKDDTDRENLISRLADLLPKTSTACYSWVFMSNHAHFLFRSGPSGLPHFMQRLLTGYVVTFNRRHQRQGALGTSFNISVDKQE